MSQYQPKTIVMSVEEYDLLLKKMAAMEILAKSQEEAIEELRSYKETLRDWLYAYKRNYEALTDKYCLPCTVGWNFSKN